MANEILINSTAQETRVALVEDGVLQELSIERSKHLGLVGNIYLGKVLRVLPGMQAAFIDIGLHRAGFIHAAELSRAAITQDIRELLREGENIVVQIIKDPIGSKGARLTRFISLPSRLLVYMPDAENTGVSQRIEDVQERERLKEIIDQLSAQQFSALKGSFIVRTAAERAQFAEFEQDMHYLQQLWQNIQARIKSQKKVSCVYEELPLELRVLRDRIQANVERIRVDSQPILLKMQQFCDDFSLNERHLLEYYNSERPLFELFRLEEEIQAALHRKVDLPSGGHIVIDQTEAMTTIDVNTGGFVGHRNLEETVFKTNLEAAHVLARQLRVRNIGGIVIIDFIDMQDVEHREQLLRTLEKALERDTMRVSISGITELGLIQVVRKRTRESLEQMLCDVCHVCHGRGTIKSIETVCNEIFRTVLREVRTYDHNQYLVLASQAVVDYLLEEESASIADLEQKVGKTLRFQVDSQYQQEQFDIVLL